MKGSTTKRGIILLTITIILSFITLNVAFEVPQTHKVIIEGNFEEEMSTEELYSFLSQGKSLFDRTYAKKMEFSVFNAEPPSLPSSINYQQVCFNLLF